MFIGHYGASFAAKALAPRVSLGTFFVAVQMLDVAFSTFVLTGIEKMRIVPGFTATNAYDLESMPYSHSLVGALAWAAACGLAWLALRRSALEAVAIAAAVASHWLFDLPVHTPDLPLTLGAGAAKVGLGLWNHPIATIALELGVLAVGALLAKSRAWAFLGVLAVLAIATPFLPAPSSPAMFAVQALFGYAALGYAAHRVDVRGRSAAPPRDPASPR